MKNWLHGKTVVLTGASSGIGKEICKILICDYGASVIGIGRSEQKMLNLVGELGALSDKFSYELFDVGSKDEWTAFSERLTEKLVTPTLLINNAGAFIPFSKTESCDSESVEALTKTNYLSAVYACEALLPIIRKSQTPAVYFVCSSSALCPVAGTAAYSASKGAMKGYAEALMLDSDGLYVGIAFPGTTKTDLFRDDENTKDSALDKIALSPKKMAKKITSAILKKRKRIVPGFDAKMMSFTAKLAPVTGLTLIKNVMKASKSKVFTNVFGDATKKKDE